MRGMLRSLLSGAFLVSAVLLACGSDDDAGGTTATPQSLARGQCAYYERCRPLFFRASFGDSAGCNATITGLVQGQLNLPGVKVTQAQVDACNARSAARPCESTNSDPECDFKGTLANGSPCAVNGQCESGSCFYETSPTGTPDCGSCKPKSKVNESCKANSCETGLNCNAADTCIVPEPAGAACKDERDCEGTLVCLDGKCAPPGVKGAKCTPTASCADGFSCVARSQTEGVCADIQLAQLGGRCGYDETLGTITDCQTSTCSDLARGGTCIADVGEGAACNEENGPLCTFGLECRNGACAKPDSAKCK
jgi:hypothetical protein